MKVELAYELVAYGKRHMNSVDETMFVTDVVLEVTEGDAYSYGELLDLSIQSSELYTKINLNTLESITLSRIIYE